MYLGGILHNITYGGILLRMRGIPCIWNAVLCVLSFGKHCMLGGKLYMVWRDTLCVVGGALCI